MFLNTKLKKETKTVDSVNFSNTLLYIVKKQKQPTNKTKKVCLQTRKLSETSLGSFSVNVFLTILLL